MVSEVCFFPSLYIFIRKKLQAKEWISACLCVCLLAWFPQARVQSGQCPAGGASFQKAFLCSSLLEGGFTSA